MGVEDYLIYVQGLNLCDTKKYGKNLIAEDGFIDIDLEIEDLILLEDNKNFEKDLENSKDLEIVSFAKINAKIKAKKIF